MRFNIRFVHLLKLLKLSEGTKLRTFSNEYIYMGGGGGGKCSFTSIFSHNTFTSSLHQDR